MSSGAKELHELVDGVMALSVKIVKHLKDGAQMEDVVALLLEYKNDPVFALYINNAVSDVSQIPAEIKDLSLVDGMPMVMSMFGWIQQLVTELKSK